MFAPASPNRLDVVSGPARNRFQGWSILSFNARWTTCDTITSRLQYAVPFSTPPKLSFLSLVQSPFFKNCSHQTFFELTFIFNSRWKFTSTTNPSSLFTVFNSTTSNLRTMKRIGSSLSCWTSWSSIRYVENVLTTTA